jgi:hypothetical protein
MGRLNLLTNGVIRNGITFEKLKAIAEQTDLKFFCGEEK